MKRCGLVLLLTLLATLAVALPGSAADAQPFKGVIVSIAPDSVAVKDAKGVVTTCARAPKSPALDGYAAGDRVQALCSRGRGHLVLVRVRHLTSSTVSSSNDTEPTRFGGVVTALSASSISVHDGDRDLSCTIDSTSPSTAAFKVGQHVKVACSSGTLVAIASVTLPTSPPAPTPPTAPHQTRGAAGTVSAVSSTSLTVHTDGGEVTCAVADGSPSTTGIHVGDRVKMGCLDGVVKVLEQAEVPPPPPPSSDHHETITVGGTLNVISSSSLTVHNSEHGDVSCTLGPLSPRLGDFHVGDHVGMACVDGVLAQLVKL